jgi:hypothetical protein
VSNIYSSRPDHNEKEPPGNLLPGGSKRFLGRFAGLCHLNPSWRGFDLDLVTLNPHFVGVDL